MIPPDHPRYASLMKRERMAECARAGIVALEGLTAHGRGEAFDYLIGEQTTESARRAETTAAAMLLVAAHPVISVNGNTAALAAGEIASLQKASGAVVEVNLFHRTEERIRAITRLLEKAGVEVLNGEAERLLPLSHGRGLCLRDGIYAADVILVPLEDGDRCQALRSLGKTVIAIDLNPLSRTAQAASLTIVDELTRAVPNITKGCTTLSETECRQLIESHDNAYLIRDALHCIRERLEHAMD
jgi:4-phosphopantoate--beta-alanine ligase